MLASQPPCECSACMPRAQPYGLYRIAKLGYLMLSTAVEMNWLLCCAHIAMVLYSRRQEFQCRLFVMCLCWLWTS